jgi:hypothetical protein
VLLTGTKAIAFAPIVLNSARKRVERSKRKGGIA